MDRRSFLFGSAAAITAATADPASAAAQQAALPAAHPMAPPVNSAAVGSSHEPFAWDAAGMRFTFAFEGNKLRFRHVLPADVREPDHLPPPSENAGLELALHCTGEDVADHHGAKLTGGAPGTRLLFRGRQESASAKGQRLTLTHEDAALGLKAESIYESFGDIPVVRRSASLSNMGKQPVGVEYLSSAMLHNLADPGTFDQDLRIHFAYNSWQAEAQWQTVSPSEAGLVPNGNFAVSGVLFSTLGSWPCQTFLPMAMIENLRLGVTWFWQIEHAGSWHCEIAQSADRALYAYLGGPDAQHAQAWKLLRPGEQCSTVPVAVGCVRGGFGEAVAALTAYRRATRLHPRSDNQRCPVVFNDVVMLDSNQTPERELPLIESAAQAGCEVFCMDAGWCSPPGENWWANVGDWEPNRNRFPGRSFPDLLDTIRRKGMMPGLWIEPEVAGMGTALAKQPDSWFFCRHGRRVVDHSRYHLDFRNGDVRAYIDRVFDRLVGKLGIGYIKLDYNINALEGTEVQSESFGQGLLGHNRAFLDWLDALLNRYPELTIETVASGSMRMEHSMLSRAQLQSISDADDYRVYASLTPGCSAAVLPEQMGVWSQPMADATPEVASCNMVGAMLGRIHQSGFVPRLQPAALAQITRGIAVYKETLREHLPSSTPFYPLGMPLLAKPDRPSALGMRTVAGTEMLAVWRRSGPEQVVISGHFSNVRLLYPLDLGIRVTRSDSGLQVLLPKPEMGCILFSGSS